MTAFVSHNIFLPRHPSVPHQCPLLLSQSQPHTVDDGDISSAPMSSRRPHHHVHTSGDSSTANATQGSAVTTGSGYPRSYYDGLASRSARLQNMPSSSSISVASVASLSPTTTKDKSPSSLAPPDSPAPQIPHAPSSHHRHASPGSPKTASANTEGLSRSTSREVKIPEIKEAAHHPAPHGFLAKMSALDLQENVKLAIDGAGADGVERNYKINKPPTDRPVRIYADGVFDLVSHVFICSAHNDMYFWCAGHYQF